MVKGSVPSRERTNGIRLWLLVAAIGTEVLRELFLSIHPQEILQGLFKKHKSKLLGDKNKKGVLRFKDQEEKVFPSSGHPPDPNTFDITLLHVLLIKSGICDVEPPKNGSRSFKCKANVTRLNKLRNQLCHPSYVEIPDEEFEIKWREISAILVDLGCPQEKIDNLRNQHIDHETACHAEEARRKAILILLVNFAFSNCRPDEIPDGEFEPNWKETVKEILAVSVDLGCPQEIIDNLRAQCMELREEEDREKVLLFVLMHYASSNRAPNEGSKQLMTLTAPSKHDKPEDEGTVEIVGRCPVQSLQSSHESFAESGLEKESGTLKPVIGRSRELDAAVRSIESGNCVYIQGAPGMGKTTLAVRLVKHLRNCYAHPVHYWDAEKTDSFLGLFKAMNLDLVSDRSQECEENPKASLLNWSKQLSGLNYKVVLVFDGMDESVNEELLRVVSEMRHLSRGNVTFVMTSRAPLRSHQVATYNLRIKSLRLGPLSLEAGEQLLLSRITSGEVRQNLTKTKEIVEACAGIPGRLCDAARDLSSQSTITQYSVIETFKRRRSLSEMLEYTLQPWKNVSTEASSKFCANLSRKHPYSQFFMAHFIRSGKTLLNLLRRKF